MAEEMQRKTEKIQRNAEGIQRNTEKRSHANRKVSHRINCLPAWILCTVIWQEGPIWNPMAASDKNDFWYVTNWSNQEEEATGALFLVVLPLHLRLLLLLIGPLLLLLQSCYCCCCYLIYCCCPQLVFIDQVPWAAIVPGLCPGESNLVFWSPRQSDLLSPLSLTNYILLPHHRWIEEIILQVDSNYPQLHSFGEFSFGVKSQLNLVYTLNWNLASKIILCSLEKGGQYCWFVVLEGPQCPIQSIGPQLKLWPTILQPCHQNQPFV